MIARLFSWLDRRTGLVAGTLRVLLEPIPGGARWRHVWGTLLALVFVTQVITGFFLWIGYSASTQTAWESVYYLEQEVSTGWFLRGLHHFTAQLLIVLLGVHLVTLILSRAYTAPRELSFWLVLLLVPLFVGISVTGWLLPYDQKAYWAARIPLNLLGLAPVIGPALQQVLIGGPEVGHLTLTRFLAMHAGLLPLLIGGILLLHLHLLFRERLVAPTPTQSSGRPYWPDQACLDAFAFALALALVVVVVLVTGGAGLGAPADPAQEYSAARPEWHFLFLYQFLKLFPGQSEIWGAVIIPTVVFLVFLLMPWIGRSTAGHILNVTFVMALLIGAAGLTATAWFADRSDRGYQAAVAHARDDGDRARLLAAAPAGIPPAGALSMVRDDPLLQGPRLFANHCAGCHRHNGNNGLGEIPGDEPSASDLYGFASRAWIAGLLDPDRVDGPHYFGGTRFEDGRMVRFVKRDVAGFTLDQKLELQSVIVALSAEAALPGQREKDRGDAALIVEGRAAMAGESMRCTECHKFHEHDDLPVGPDLTGYGSREWLIDFIGDPAHARFYGRRNDRMPRYAEDQVLQPGEIELIADWLRGDWYAPEP
jgi:ubiquinol-cytochrome c reductase cytochrome b subunit